MIGYIYYNCKLSNVYAEQICRSLLNLDLYHYKNDHVKEVQTAKQLTLELLAPFRKMG